METTHGPQAILDLASAEKKGEVSPLSEDYATQTIPPNNVSSAIKALAANRLCSIPGDHSESNVPGDMVSRGLTALTLLTTLQK